MSMTGEIQGFGGNFAPVGWAFCDGQTLSIDANRALFSVIGNQYGGDGKTNFQVPNLAPLKNLDTYKTPLKYIICLEGVPGAPFLGEIRLFAGNAAPSNWAFCDGKTLSRFGDYYHLFDLIGNQYGGDGQNNFQVPNLAPLKEVDGGATLIRYIISLTGTLSTRDSYSSSDFTDDSLIGQARLFTGNVCPPGWYFCQGGILRIDVFRVLFSVLGNTYGGDYRDKFQLPNLTPLQEADGGTTPICYIIALEGIYPTRP
jgi:microcystin-dependent protein